MTDKMVTLFTVIAGFNGSNELEELEQRGVAGAEEGAGRV